MAGTPTDDPAMISRRAELTEALKRLKERRRYSYSKLEIMSRRLTESDRGRAASSRYALQILRRSTVESFLNGRNFPSEDVLYTFLRACGLPEQETEAWIGALRRVRREQARPMTAADERVGHATPHQLLSHFPHFTGRAAELASLDSHLAAPGPRRPLVITGIAGIGKSTLALYWANQIADRFPDGELYVDLRGFDPVNDPLSPSVALRGFLTALGVAVTRIPTDQHAQAALFRSIMASRRMLIVLDNARGSEQVADLLPGGASLVVMTSRHRLDAIRVRHAARGVALEQLTTQESVDMLASVLGDPRWRESAAARTLAQACGGLPLALSVVGTRGADDPSALGQLVQRVESSPDVLDTVSSADASVDPRSVFSWSYRLLGERARRAFRALGMSSGPHFSLGSVASLLGAAQREAEILTNELRNAGLLDIGPVGRLRMHDLLRSYAIELMQEAVDDTSDARIRLFSYYAVNTFQADRFLDHIRAPIPMQEIVTRTFREDLRDFDESMAWLEAEWQNITTIVRLASEAGEDRHAIETAWSLVTFLHRQGHWTHYLDTQQIAVQAAQRLEDRQMEATALRNLGNAHAQLGHLAEAVQAQQRALELHALAGDPHGQARTERALGYLRERQKDYAQAVAHAERALALSRRASDQVGEAQALNALGWYSGLTGDYKAALRYCGEALVLLRATGDQTYEAHALDSIGVALHHLGRPSEALENFESAVHIYELLHDRYYEAETRVHVGEALIALDDPAGAKAQWNRAAGVFDEIAHPNGPALRDRINRLDVPLP